jgi:C4-dicarboxylate transporter/malic acid transport protein
MGTAVVGIIAYQNPGGLADLTGAGRAVGVAMVGLSIVMAAVLGIPYAARWLRYPASARADFANPAVGGLYGTVPGGLLVLALGIATVGPSVADEGAVTTAVLALAVVGVILAFAISVVFSVQLFLRSGVEAPAANGAWFIPPVVTIIVPVVLATFTPHVGPADLPALAALEYAFWGMGFLLFVLVASLVYDRLVFHPLPGAPLAPSVWIGLGPVGVGSLALLRLASTSAPVWGDAAPAVSAASTLAATALWGLGLWWLAASIVVLGAYLRRGRLPYGVGWWGFTFPLGAFTAATIAIARAWHAGWLEALGVVLFAGLVGFWVVVVLRTATAMRSGEAWIR